MPAINQSDHDFLLEQLKSGNLDPESDRGAKAMDLIEEFRKSPGSQNQDMLTNAIPTGNPNIDGSKVERRYQYAAGEHPFRMAETPEEKEDRRVRRIGVVKAGLVEPDSEEAVTADGASRGIDYRVGTPTWRAFKTASAVDQPEVKNFLRKKAIDELAARTADGDAIFKTDRKTQDILYARIVTQDDVDAGKERKEDIGKKRWTSLKSAGFTMQDAVEYFSLPEAGSIIGGVAGSIATKNLTFFKQAGNAGTVTGFKQGMTGTAGESTLGFAGREVGVLLSALSAEMQGAPVDWMEILKQIPSDAGKEALTAIAGRSLTRTAEGIKTTVVKNAARLRGLTPVEGTLSEVAARNTSMRETAEDIKIINQKMADAEPPFQERITSSRAESETQLGEGLALKEVTGQRARLNLEEGQRVNTGQGNKEMTQMRDAENMTVLRALSDEARNTPVGTEKFTAQAGNRAVQEAETIRIRPIGKDSGIIQTAGENTGGVEFKVTPQSLSVTKYEFPELMNDVGVDLDVHRGLLDFGASEGKAVNSGIKLSNEEDLLWRDLKREGYDVVRNPTAKPVVVNSRRMGWITEDAGPVYSVAAPKGIAAQTYINTATAAYSRAGSKAGRDRAKDEWERLLYNPTALQKATLKNEVSGNLPARVGVLEQTLKSYDEVVNPGGKWAGKEVQEQWYADAAGVLEHLMSVSEFSAVRSGSPGAFRKFVTSQQAIRDDLVTGLGQVLKVGNDKVFTSNKNILATLQTAERPAQRRALAMIRQSDPEMWGSLQAQVRVEVGRAMSAPLQGKSVTRQGQASFGKWLDDNTTLLNDLNPDEGFLKKAGNTTYVDDLYRFNRQLGREASRRGSLGVKQLQNPPLLQMSRTIMGVMNKWQRRVTAGRKLQMHKWYGRVVAIVQDPEKLREMIALSELAPRLDEGSTAMVAGAIRLGLVDSPEEYKEMIKASSVWQHIVADEEEKGKE